MKILERRLGLVAVVAISLSAMLGSGIFVLPGLAAEKTGSSVWLAYIVAGMCVLPATLSKAELATAMPTSGGTYVYLDRAFGPLVGTISGLGLWVSLLLKSAFALVGFSAYLDVLAHVPAKLTSLFLLVGIIVLNILGVRNVSRVQIIVVAVSIVGLAVLGVGTAPRFEWNRLDDFLVDGTGGFISAVAFVFVSYAGVTKVAAIAEEVKQPDRNLPLGMILSLVIAIGLYGGITLIMVGVIPVDAFHGDLHPVYSLAASLEGWTVIGIGAAVLGVVTMTSMANAGLLATSRFPFAMSRGQLLPARLSQLNSRYLTPTASILLTGAAMAAAILLLDVGRIAKLASSVMIMVFIGVNVTVIVLRETRVQWYRPGFRSPLYPWVQIFGILTGLVLLVVMGPLAVLAGLAIIIPGVILYLTYGRQRSGRLGVVGQRGRRKELLTSQPSSSSMSALSSTDLEVAPAVVVALFGTERSPEMLVELADAMREGGQLEVVRITEIPEQTGLDVAIDSVAIDSVKRRVSAVAEMREVALSFDSVATRDVLDTVNSITERWHCRWLVMERTGRKRGVFTIYNPIGWLADHLTCNLAAFHDAGVRYIRKILVHVQPGPHDALVLGIADCLAEENQASLTFVRFVPDDAPAAQAQSAGDYLDQVRRISGAASDTRLLRGGIEEDAIVALTPAYDLLISAGAPQGGVWQRIRGSNVDRIIEAAACSVLTLLAPPASAHESFVKYRPRTAQHEPPLVDLVHPECVRAGVAPMKKDALFNYFADSFAAALPDVESAAVAEALWERERTQNTALGEGIALPHATLEAAGTTHLGVFVTRGPVDYQTPDEQDIDVFFVTLGTSGDRQTHLVLLSKIATLCLQSDLLVRLRSAETSDEMLAAIRECSERVS